MSIINYAPEDFQYTIRRATAQDIDAIYDLIQGLAEYEKGHVSLTKEELLADGFGPRPYYYVFIAETKTNPVQAIGFALYFYQYSTWEGRTLYLEDLFIKIEHRKNGLGYQLLQVLAKEAKDNNCRRFQWTCLDWNTPSIEFYKKIGAKELDEWLIFRMDSAAIDKFLSEKKLDDK
eukprot:TRINITY_DN14328_c0_g1_i1.p1 TRINITY_DN14328_c0_g1~~TRINITY_DN14328_c0_g1_i1.p1  ORF type:complete len:176 (+),score=34.49 TRINITY_DN14328_c0_g1_i1:34-561(+)